MQLRFTLEYWQDGGLFVGRLKGVPGIFCQGKTLAELRDNVRDVYQMMVEDEVQPPEGSQTIELTVDA
jgi:predicted RNase H-like HicB family nuclease